MAVEGAGADAGLPGDVVESGVGSVLREGEPGDVKDALAVALRVGSRLANGRRRRCGFGHTLFSQKVCNRRRSPDILLFGECPRL